jgi:hypothetical protein
MWLRTIETVRVGRAVCIWQEIPDAIFERGTTPPLERQ